ncbi:hypothetical protein HIM_04876 [Hirsutella minnesotensis 3608]|uniref:DNA damage-responsive protein 48 n=1 Tax=Hirsutella minnesotensis 3608 TaxID=1043627 RepID=A0A0F8A5Q1_9HYPO|nr:hypothetical protein HIM_04876 [Hirsutella minnesotensis 3608]
MDFVNKLTGGGGNSTDSTANQNTQQSGGFMDKINNAAGGGKQGEENEDALDKAVDMFQDKVLGQGDQSNESAAEQAKDEAISDFIRDKYKSTTGKDFPIADKDKKMGF